MSSLSHRDESVMIAVMGMTGSGKSPFIAPCNSPLHFEVAGTVRDLHLWSMEYSNEPNEADVTACGGTCLTSSGSFNRNSLTPRGSSVLECQHWLSSQTKEAMAPTITAGSATLHTKETKHDTESELIFSPVQQQGNDLWSGYKFVIASCHQLTDGYSSIQNMPSIQQRDYLCAVLIHFPNQSQTLARLFGQPQHRLEKLNVAGRAWF